MTTLPSFPVLAGQGWSIHKKPTFSTLVASHVSGREVRDALYANPIWSFEVTFNGLDGTASGRYGGLGAASLQSLMGLFLQCRGQFSSFIYFDPTDYQVSAQGFGTGDGATTTFQLVRVLGSFSEPIILPVLSPTTLQFPSGVSVSATAPTITAAGSPVSPSTYLISSPGGAVNFATAPASGAALAWTGFFGFLCRFDADDLDFEQFMTNLWRAESVKFRSLRQQ